ncbi:DUF6011 domain-containing protein [Streptacidiphilus rugosus]|uniref:DUF6011 domain-containing protein n=1 Tax=Streptacidiphilus rugosus TaxID=405783 RepID=UPI000569D65C|nr:DUF6011 domain-containing protein [Streptacidiphilus rugosus]
MTTIPLPGVTVERADDAVVRCEGCGRPLRDPASRARGHGPVCTVVRLPEPPRGEQQETLPGF